MGAPPPTPTPPTRTGTDLRLCWIIHPPDCRQISRPNIVANENSSRSEPAHQALTARREAAGNRGETPGGGPRPPAGPPGNPPGNRRPPRVAWGPPRQHFPHLASAA